MVLFVAKPNVGVVVEVIINVVANAINNHPFIIYKGMTINLLYPFFIFF